MTQIFPVEESSRIAEARRVATSMAHQEGLDETDIGNLALIVTELCTNLLKHAKRGEVCLSPLSERSGEPGIEVLAIDRGPGMDRVDRCLADGYSSTQTSGNGLGAIVRLSQAFDIYSQLGKGTVVLAQVTHTLRPTAAIGAIVKPIAGEELSGDSWACLRRNGHLHVIVADGLGHGALAAQASIEAVSAFKRANSLAPNDILLGVHSALRSTRGAAVAVMTLGNTGSIEFSGVGNISGVICGNGKSQFMVSNPGTAGYGSPKIQTFAYTAPEGALVVMHSDGITTSWNIDSYPGLRTHHPSVIAGVLYRDASRDRDDTCVVVARPEKDT